MKSNELQAGKVYDIPTIHSENPNYFVVRTDDGKTFNIKKLKFQNTQPTPDVLPCMVKSVHDGQPLILLDLTPYINHFYEEGKIYLFRVKADYTRNNFYEVEDEYGLFFRLPVTDTALNVGQSVACKVIKISGCIVHLKLQSATGSVRTIPFWQLSEIKEKVFGNERIPVWIRRFICSEESLPLRNQYDENDARWLINAIKFFIKKVPVWFQESDKTDYDLITAKLEDLRQVSQTLLEGCDYLAKCSNNERLSYRNQLSEMTSTFNHFLRACGMLKGGDHKEFIDRMFSNLKLSGYLYNPDKQFHTFNTILRIHPQLIHEWMGQIFDALTSWNIQNWKMEPFRSAFVRQTELYIRENQKEVDELANFKSKKDNAIISKMIMAIAIQMLIVEDGKDDVDINRNRAMFYRYISYLNNAAQHTLLDKAFRCTMGCQFKPEFTWEHLRQLEMLITLSGVDNAVTLPENTLKTYSNGNNFLEISTGGIILRHGDPKNPHPLLPNGLQLWRGLQIYADVDCSEVKVPSAAKSKDLNAYKTMWSDIDEVLFPPKNARIRKVGKMRPEAGDGVKICIDGIEKTADGKILCSCTIVDDVYEGCGVLNVKNIVRYGCEPSIHDFYDEETGRRMIFEANVQGMNQDGRLAFNMLEQVDRSIKDDVSFGEVSRCVITNRLERTFMCLSEYGYSVVVARDESTKAYDTVHFVWVEVREAPSANKIKGYIIEPVADEERFAPTLPIHNILQRVCVGIEESEESEDDNVIQAEETITYDQVDELIAIIRRFAFSSADYVQAYNYLGFACVLAKMVSHEMLVTLCHEHMELLILLQSFAKNRSVDAMEVEKHSLSALNNPMLGMLYTRLFVVSNIGRPEYDHKLWEMLDTAGSEEDANLIRKVLTLNLLKRSDGLDRPVKNAILEQIGKILKVNFHQSNLKFYGAENQYVEFKTSIVFPAGNFMKPDVDKQNYEIASIICGFLNADGGTLYIGVNDQGYECGIDNDMEYYKVSNMDKYILKIGSMIQNMLGSTASDYITIDRDTDCKHNVAVVKIKPSLRVICMKSDNEVYVRHTTSTRPKLGEDLEIFKKDRELRYQQIVESSKVMPEIYQ